MNKYKVVKTIGKGAFGEVYSAVNTKDGTKVAIKKLFHQHTSWKSCLVLPELKALKRLNKHANIVRVYEMVLEKQLLHFVFEFLDSDLHAVSCKFDLSVQDIRCASRQILQGLKFMHTQGFFHRDLKPENILCAFRKPDAAVPKAANPHPCCMSVKLTDFGITREIRSRPPFTPYVSTRWYRAPELVLRSTQYNSPVDVWAFACVVAELFLRQPLLPGSSNYDQALQTLSIVGVPSPELWPAGERLLTAIGGTFLRLPSAVTTWRKTHAMTLEELISLRMSKTSLYHPLRGHRIPPEVFSLLRKLFVLDPLMRLTAKQALEEPFLTGNCDCPSTTSHKMPSQSAAADSSNCGKATEESSKPRSVVKQLDNLEPEGNSPPKDLLMEAESFMEQLEFEPDTNFVSESWDDSPEKNATAARDQTVTSIASSNADHTNQRDLGSDDLVDDFNSFDTEDDADGIAADPSEVGHEPEVSKHSPKTTPVETSAQKNTETSVHTPEEASTSNDWDADSVETETVDLCDAVAMAADSRAEQHSDVDIPAQCDKIKRIESPSTDAIALGAEDGGGNDSVLTRRESTSPLTETEALSPSPLVDSLSSINSSPGPIQTFNEDMGSAEISDIESRQSSDSDDDARESIPMLGNVTDSETHVAEKLPLHLAPRPSETPLFTPTQKSRLTLAADEKFVNKDDNKAPPLSVLDIPTVPSEPATAVSPDSSDRSVPHKGHGTGANAHGSPSKTSTWFGQKDAASVGDGDAEESNQASSDDVSSQDISDAIVDAAIREHLKKKGALGVLEAYRDWTSKSDATPTVSFHSRTELFQHAGPRITKYYREQKKLNKDLSVLDAVLLANVITAQQKRT